MYYKPVLYRCPVTMTNDIMFAFLHLSVWWHRHRHWPFMSRSHSHVSPSIRAPSLWPAPPLVYPMSWPHPTTVWLPSRPSWPLVTGQLQPRRLTMRPKWPLLRPATMAWPVHWTWGQLQVSLTSFGFTKNESSNNLEVTVKAQGYFKWCLYIFEALKCEIGIEWHKLTSVVAFCLSINLSLLHILR